MGIINCTPDSFHKNSRVANLEAALSMAEKHIAEGAQILDIGACSTRPGAEIIPVQEEINRLMPVVEAIRKQYPEILISIDSFQYEVIEKVLPLGIDIVNDVSGLADEKILTLIAKKNIAYVLMHNQTDAKYNNVTSDVYRFFQNKLEILKKNQVNNVVIDLGFGFAKSLENNFELLKNINLFNNLNTPILIGVSRKSMICRTLKCSPEESLNGTTAIHAIALQKGGNILRVHDVKEAMQVVKLHQLL